LAVGGLAAAAVLLSVSPVLASEHKVVVVVANRVLLADLRSSSLQSISKMMADGAVGLVSPNCAGPKTEPSVLMTAAAGAACRGAAYTADCYDAREQTIDHQLAGQAYLERFGRRARDGSAVFLGAAQAARENKRLGGLLWTGSIGDALHRACKKTCAIGNADLPPDVYDRSVAVLAADSRGLIDLGLLAPPPRGLCDFQDRAYPMARVASEVITALARADLVVYNFGRTTTLDDNRISISDEVFARQWSEALAELDTLVGQLMQYTDKSDVSVILVSFSPPKGPRWTDLTPIVVYPSFKKALLTSAATRTPGLIAASDFAPTVLKLMDVRVPVGVTGHAAAELRCADKLAVLDTLEQRVVAKRILELPMLWTVGIIAMVSCTLSALAVAFGVFARANKITRIGLLVGVASLLGMLIASVAPSGAMGYAVVAALVVVFAVTLAWDVGRRTLRRCVVEGTVCPPAMPVVVIFWATAACVLVDSAFGGTLCKFSLPSSYQIAAFRFYGIGNEYAGVLIAMAALALLFSGRAFRSRAVSPVGLIVVAFLGVGSLGANYGATLTAVVTFGLLWMAVSRGGFKGRHVVMWFAIGMVITAAFIILDWKLNGAQGAHAGQTGATAAAVGGDYWADLIGRKVLMNLKLTFSNTAQRAFLGFAPFIGLWLWKIHSRVKALFAEDKVVFPGLKALLVGAVVAYAVNDSGIVIASIMVAMTVAILLYTLLEGRAGWAGS